MGCLLQIELHCINLDKSDALEPPHGNTNNLHRRKQRRLFLKPSAVISLPCLWTPEICEAKTESFTSHIYNFDLLHKKALSFNWNTLQYDDFDIYANNIENKLILLSRECIPNMNIKVRPYEPPWLTSYIKHKKRKRKRAFKKAKRTDIESQWSKFKSHRNEVVDLIRNSKKNNNFLTA